jgi:putative two-component system response regulator
MLRLDERRVLAVDDSFGIRELLKSVVAPIADITAVASGAEALFLLDGGTEFDLILLDVSMPEMDGYDVIKLIKRHPSGRSIPVIFLTGHIDKSAEEKGLRHGAVDYITKPISPSILLARVKNQLDLKKARDQIASYNLRLEERVRERTHEIELTQDAAILSLASLAETRDNETGNHIRRTQRYVRMLSDRLLEDGIYADELSVACWQPSRTTCARRSPRSGSAPNSSRMRSCKLKSWPPWMRCRR